MREVASILILSSLLCVHGIDDSIVRDIANAVSSAAISSTLASLTGDRSPFNAHLTAVAKRRSFVELELLKFTPNVRRQAFAQPLVGGSFVSLTNTVAVLSNATEKVILVTAHIDTFPGTPGADGDGSGVAALVEVARVLAAFDFGVSLELVVFDGTLDRAFWTPAIHDVRYGSRFFAANDDVERAAGGPSREVVGIINLDGVGWFQTAPQTQRYPANYSALFPDVVAGNPSFQGNFLRISANTNGKAMQATLSAHWQRWLKAGLANPSFRLETVAPEEGWSAEQRGSFFGLWDAGDGASFWSSSREAVAVVGVSDTQWFRILAGNKLSCFEAACDTMDHVDVDLVSQAARTVATGVAVLAGARRRPEPSTLWWGNQGALAVVLAAVVFAGFLLGQAYNARGYMRIKSVSNSRDGRSASLLHGPPSGDELCPRAEEGDAISHTPRSEESYFERAKRAAGGVLEGSGGGKTSNYVPYAGGDEEAAAQVGRDRPTRPNNNAGNVGSEEYVCMG